jgi:hypothetical protein
MLKDRILSTLRFFDLQDYPLTLLELHKFLLADLAELKSHLDQHWELKSVPSGHASSPVPVGEILNCLETEMFAEIECRHGFYALRGRGGLVDQRLENYLYGIKREQLIRRFLHGVRRVPFVRGVALAGSQAMGQQKQNSDIDLLIIVDPKFLWLARTGVTAYFQFFGHRRHGQKIANRFCLNHYLAGIKRISELRNLYTAWEYAKLRPLAFRHTVAEYQQKNLPWLAMFFPNFEPNFGSHTANFPEHSGQIWPQYQLEQMLSGAFGRWLEAKLKNWQLPNIRQEKFILVRDDELSFHPQSKQKDLLQKFFAGNLFFELQ